MLVWSNGTRLFHARQQSVKMLMQYIRKIALSAVSFALLAGVFTALPASAQIHPGDTVLITVFNHPDISERVIVDGAGNISVPLVGSIAAGNAEPQQLAGRIRAALSRYMPKVAVQVQIVARNQSLFISGGPGGVLPYTPGETLADALAQLQSPQGGLPNAQTSTPANSALHDLLHGRVNLQDVRILRDGKALGPFDMLSQSSAGQSGPRMLAGDTIRLIDKPVRIDVRGEVKEPGYAYLNPDEPLSDALIQVGGYVPTSAGSNLILQRAGRTQNITAGDLAQTAYNGDVVIVPRAPRIGVTGAVQKPGDVVLAGDTSLLSALYDAGGPLKYANLQRILVFHAGTYTSYDITALQHGDVQGNPVLHDGDMVFVPEGHKIDFSMVWQALAATARFIVP